MRTNPLEFNQEIIKLVLNYSYSLFKTQTMLLPSPAALVELVHLDELVQLLLERGEGPMMSLTQLSNCLTLEGSFSSVWTATIARVGAFCRINIFLRNFRGLVIGGIDTSDSERERERERRTYMSDD